MQADPSLSRDTYSQVARCFNSSYAIQRLMFLFLVTTDAFPGLSYKSAGLRMRANRHLSDTIS
jgi:hypothetical protein